MVALIIYATLKVGKEAFGLLWMAVGILFIVPAIIFLTWNYGLCMMFPGLPQINILVAFAVAGLYVMFK